MLYSLPHGQQVNDQVQNSIESNVFMVSPQRALYNWFDNGSAFQKYTATTSSVFNNRFLLLTIAIQKVFEKMYCNCSHIEEYHVLPLCAKWFSHFKKPSCFLNGGSNSSLCPGAVLVRIRGKKEFYYTSSHLSICEKADSKLM